MSFERFQPGPVDWVEEPAPTPPPAADPPGSDAVATVRKAVALMEQSPRPEGYSERAWYQVLRDLRIFTDHWLDIALGCGWALIDLYGAPKDLRHNRLDQVGAALLLDGRQVLSIDPNRIVIENGPSGPSIFYRQAPGVSVPFDRTGGRLIWETLRLTGAAQW